MKAQEWILVELHILVHATSCMNYLPLFFVFCSSNSHRQILRSYGQTHKFLVWRLINYGLKQSKALDRSVSMPPALILPIKCFFPHFKHNN